MKNRLPIVSIIIPCRNEEKFIQGCLDSVLRQTYPKDRFEILVVDGMSEDRTREILKNYSERVELLDNPKRIFASANNIGIKKAKGEIIMILGCHAVYQADYIEKCVRYLKEYNADNVGGKAKAVPARNTIISRAITLSLGGRFGRGREEREEIRWADTVFGGCYKKEVFQKIGLFNENLKRSSDMDFNLRLIRSGGKILVVPDVIISYYPKDNLKDFFLHNIRDGIWAILPFKFTKRPMKLRHYFPLLFILTLPLNIWFYIPTSFYFSIKIALREKNIKYLFVIPIVFATRHIGYGLGSVWGLIKLIL